MQAVAGMRIVAINDVVISAANIDPALLAALKAAQPNQIGDDLVLVLPDGRIFYIDGFFAPDEVGDGQPPQPEAIPLARDIADLLLGATPDLPTAAGGEAPPAPSSSGTGFIPFPTGGPAPDLPRSAARDSAGDAERSTFEQERGVEGATRRFETPQNIGGSTSSSALPFSLSAIGTISLAAGDAGAPNWTDLFAVRQMFSLERLTNALMNGVFQGLAKSHVLGDALDAETFVARFDPQSLLSPEMLRANYADYLGAHADLVDFVGNGALWANLTPQDGVHDNGKATSGDYDAATVFAGNDAIFGSGLGVDYLYGFGGDDKLVAYGGENHLSGGEGDDFIASVQGASPLTIDGGEGEDTFLFIIQNAAFPIFARDIGAITSIERLVLLPQDTDNPVFLNEDNGVGRIVPGNLVFDIDAATILAWGGHLSIDSDVADIRLSDVSAWERVGDDPDQAGYILYRAIYAGQTVTLSIRASADQPIAALVEGTSGNDLFFLGDRKFDLFDGRAGDDQVFGGLMGDALGTIDLSDPTTLHFLNVENFVTAATSDRLIVSAPGVAGVTDSRNILWITGAALGSSAALGHVDFADPATWTAVGYLSIETNKLFHEVRTGEVFAAIAGGETVYLFVQLGIETSPLALVPQTSDWKIAYAGEIVLPPPGAMSHVRTIDMANGLSNYLLANVQAFSEIAGADGSIVINGDLNGDFIEFADLFNWRLIDSNAAGRIYRGDDGSGHVVDLHLGADLVQPYLLPDWTSSDLDQLDLGNGHRNILTLDADKAFALAGADHRLSIYGDWNQDEIVLSDPQNWTLTQRDNSFFVYTASDGQGGSLELRLHNDLLQPLLQPVGTNGDDHLFAVRLNGLDVIEGGDGFDILTCFDAGQVPLKYPFIHEVEAIDLRNGEPNIFGCDAETLVQNDASGPVFIYGDIGDTVMIFDPLRWSDTGTTISRPELSSEAFHVYEAVYATGNGNVVKQLAVEVTLIQPDLT